MTIARRTAAVVACSLALLVATPEAATAGKPVFPGAKPINLTTKTKGVGAHPILRWKAVGGVTTYVVVVQTAKGSGFWTGRTPDPELRLGGGPLDAPSQAGAAELTKKMKWYVLGLDGAGDVVAASAKRAISP
jgi:hypothetical protein